MYLKNIFYYFIDCSRVYSVFWLSIIPYYIALYYVYLKDKFVIAIFFSVNNIFFFIQYMILL